MEQSIPNTPPVIDARNASHRVFTGILKDLEEKRVVPGQRLIETDIAARFGVGRNAVREAMQRLEARGIVELPANRSPIIRMLDLEETMEVLDVSNVMNGLLCRSAAKAFNRKLHGPLVRKVTAEIKEASEKGDIEFNRSRRLFYNALIEISGNRELKRVFPAISMHIFSAQYQSNVLRKVRRTDYLEILSAIASGDGDAAEKAGKGHVEKIREIILQDAGS